MATRMHRLLPLVLTGLVAACSSGFSGGKIGSGSDALAPEERRLQSVENKLVEVTRKIDNLTSTQSGGGGGRVADELRSLRGEIEQLRNALETGESRNRQLYQDIDQRLQRVEGRGAAPQPPGYYPSAPPPASSGAPPPPAAPSASASSADEDRAYNEAFDLLKAGRYDDAIGKFQRMVDQYPQGRYADKGLYWMGEARYVKQDYAAAQGNFEALLQRFPSSDKAAGALLKIGFCQQQLKQNSQARSTLERLMRDFPNSTEANLARQRLAQLARDGA